MNTIVNEMLVPHGGCSLLSASSDCCEHCHSWEFQSSGLDRSFRFLLISLLPLARCSSCTGQTEFMCLDSFAWDLRLARIENFNTIMTGRV